MNRNLKITILTLIVLLCTSCDLTTKWMAKRHLQSSAPIQIINNYFELHYTENTAIAFSMLRSVEAGFRKWIIYSLTLFATLFLSILIWKSRNYPFCWLLSLMLILSGALGNIGERMFRGYVVDFIHVHYQHKWSWPVFNIADVLITCGAIFLAILTLFKNPEETVVKKNLSNEDAR